MIGSCRGIKPGLHGLVILENGDISLLRSSAGLHFDAAGSTASHGGANTKERHVRFKHSHNTNRSSDNGQN